MLPHLPSVRVSMRNRHRKEQLAKLSLHNHAAFIDRIERMVCSSCHLLNQGVPFHLVTGRIQEAVEKCGPESQSRAWEIAEQAFRRYTSVRISPVYQSQEISSDRLQKLLSLGRWVSKWNRTCNAERLPTPNELRASSMCDGLSPDEAIDRTIATLSAWRMSSCKAS
jgi:hypothetical protein